MEEAGNMALAAEMLNDPDIVGHMDMEAYLKLCLAAGYSEEASQKAASDWGFKRLCKDMNA